MSHLLARFHRYTLDAEAARNVEMAIKEAVVITVEPGSPAGKRLLRGIPCVANGVPGTQPGTAPLEAALDLVCDCGAPKKPEYSTCQTCYARKNYLTRSRRRGNM